MPERSVPERGSHRRSRSADPAPRRAAPPPDRPPSDVQRPGSTRALRRGQIVEAARSLVAESGLDALTYSALEARVGLSRGVLTYHFRNKDEIVLAVLESAVTEIDRALLDAVRLHAPFPEQVRAVLQAVVHGYLDHPEAGHILMSFWSRVHTDRRVRARNAELYDNYRRMSRLLIETGQQAGVFADAPAEPLAALMVGIVIGIATQFYFDPGAIDPDAVVDEATRAVLARLGASEG